jgi:hypothetical protein
MPAHRPDIAPDSAANTTDVPSCVRFGFAVKQFTTELISRSDMNPREEKLLTFNENDHTIDERPSRETFPRVTGSALSIVRRSKTLRFFPVEERPKPRGARLERVASFALLLGIREVWGHFLFVDSQKRYLHRQPVCRCSACAQGHDIRSASARLLHSYGQPQRP